MSREDHKRRIFTLLGILVVFLGACFAVFYFLPKNKASFDLPSINIETSYIKPEGSGEIFVFFDENKKIIVSEKRISMDKMSQMFTDLTKQHGGKANVIMFIDKDLPCAALKPFTEKMKEAGIQNFYFAVYKQGNAMPMVLSNFAYLKLLPQEKHRSISQDALKVRINNDKVYLSDTLIEGDSLKKIDKLKNILIQIKGTTEFNDLVRFLGACLENKIPQDKIYIND